MNAPEQPPTLPPRQRFPSGKQALVVFFGSLALSLTTCMSVLGLVGDRQLSQAQVVLVGLVVAVATFTPLVGVIVVVMYFVRRRATRREKDAS